MPTTIRDLVAAELAEPVDPRIAAIAHAIAARHGDASRAVLFYGSCLRDVAPGESLLDFYLIVSDYRSAFDKGWMARANALVPPNVFPFSHGDLQAKYAVLSEADFHRLNGPETRNVSVWARFAQPSRLVWSHGDAAADKAIAAVARAAPTLLWSVSASTDVSEPLDHWREAFANSYRAELRAERKNRAASVVNADPDRYRRFTAPARAAFERPLLGRQEQERAWKRRRREGKMLSVARLAKASATYAGGAEYIAWKINRHAGTDIVLKPWQKRHPLLGAISLLPRLLKSGAIR